MDCMTIKQTRPDNKDAFIYQLSMPTKTLPACASHMDASIFRLNKKTKMKYVLMQSAHATCQINTLSAACSLKAHQEEARLLM